VEDFLAQHPDYANDDEDALMVARIEHERAERETLETQRQEQLKRKQRLIADNKKRKDDLASLDKDLEKFIDVRSLVLRLDLTAANPQDRLQNPSRCSSRKWYEAAKPFRILLQSGRDITNVL
jgi:hypothetical protein